MAEREPNGRSQTREMPVESTALNARYLPFGETFGEPTERTAGGAAMKKRMGSAGLGARATARAPSASTASPPKTAKPQARRSRLFRRAATGTGTPAREPDSVIHLRSCRRSRAVCQRSSGSFSRQRMTARSSAGGESGASTETGCGVSFKMAAMRLAWLFPWNGRRPVAIS